MNAVGLIDRASDVRLKVNTLDPGVTTGYVSGVIEDGKLGVVSGQAEWTELQMYLQLELSKPDIIIYERFEYRSESAYGKKYGNLDNVDLYPRNLIGVINMYCQKREAEDNPLILYTQMPAKVLGKKAFWTDDKLKKSYVLKPGQEHANDAMRHMLYWWQFGSGYQYNTNGFEPLA